MTAVTAPGARLRTAWPHLAGLVAVATGSLLRMGRPRVRAVPGLAGSAMVSLGVAMIYLPAGVIAGGCFLLWIGTELNRRT